MLHSRTRSHSHNHSHNNISMRSIGSLNKCLLSEIVSHHCTKECFSFCRLLITELGQNIASLFQEFYSSVSGSLNIRQTEDQNSTSHLVDLVGEISSGMEQLNQAKQIASAFANSVGSGV
ncbi:hypothetical protein P9112_012161 [Eukaryota sp. TZLM1-RC]